MVSSNRITHNNPEPGDVLLEFLDSASSLCDMMNTTMAAVPDEIMSTRADEACGAEYGARSDRRVNSRNGYRSRRLDTAIGTPGPRAPRPGSGSRFPTGLPGRRSRTERALAAAVAEMCATGTSTRKAGRVAAKFGAGSPPRDRVSRLCAAVDGEVDAFLARDWSAMRLAYLFPGATYAGCRVSGRVRPEALAAAIGVGDDGRRRLVGLACANAGGYASWRGLPRDLEGRGACDVRLVTSDAHDGLAGAIMDAYPEATWQRRVARARRDVLARAGGGGTGAAPAPPCPPSSGSPTPRSCAPPATRPQASWPPSRRAPPACRGTPRSTRSHTCRSRASTAPRSGPTTRGSARAASPGAGPRSARTFPSTESVLRLLGGIVGEADADWASENLLVSKESPGPVLGLERAERRIEGFAPSEEAGARAEVIMMVAPGEYAKAS